MERRVMARRTLLTRAARLGAGLATGGALAGCGGSAAAGLGEFRLQIFWVPAVTFVAEYLAARRRLFERAGFDRAVLKHGGPNSATEPILLSGKADMSISLIENFAAAVAEGAPLVAVATRYQRTPLCVISLMDRPIRTPADLAGKRIGVQAVSENLWSAFLKVNRIDPASVTKVPAQQDAAPLISGQVDGHIGYADGVPVSLRMQGRKPVVMRFSDFGFSLFEDLYVVTRDELEHHRPRVLAGLKAILAASAMTAQNPGAALDTALASYLKGTDTDPRLARAQLDQMLTEQSSPLTAKRGIGYLAPSDVKANVRTLALAGLDISPASFSTTLLDELYAKGPHITW